jgi:hypothetical protein
MLPPSGSALWCGPGLFPSLTPSIWPDLVAGVSVFLAERRRASGCCPLAPFIDFLVRAGWSGGDKAKGLRML